MSLWLLFGAMTLVALALLLWPLLRRHAEPLARRDYDLSVYRAQLQELERDRARGLLGEAEAEAARLEVQRRMLVADTERSRGAPAGTRPRAGRAAAALLLVAFPLLCGILYLQLGSPGVPSRPFAGRSEERQQLADRGGLPSVEAMMARLEERVDASPDDFEAWLRLGSAYGMAEQFEQAADAYRRAIGLQPEVAPLHAALAEVLALAAGGIVTQPAHAEIERALELDPKEPRARFYQGLELAQRGEQHQALDVWVRLARDSPADAPWLPALREQATALARDLGLDPADVLPESKAPAVAADEAAPPRPDAGQARAMADLPPEAQQAAIREMVEGLAARLERQPDDLQGWRMLARSYGVLGEPEKAAEAYEKVARLAPEDLAAQRDYAEALLALQSAGQALAPELVEQMRRVEALDRENPLVLFFLGRAAQERGDVATARDYWQQLLAMLPEDAPERAPIEDLLEQLDAVN
jgi:cytochrome c-type biogenesis protein CcmH